MLKLSRRIGQQIFIKKGQIEIHILYIKDGQVGLGIKAPKHIDVDRKEIFLLKRTAKLEESQKNQLLKSFPFED